MASVSHEPDARFGARAVFAALAIVLVAVPFGLLLFLVEARWPPLSEVDAGARDDLHTVALHHHGLVTALKLLSTIGSAVVYVPLFAAVAAWLAWRRLPRLALFAVVTVSGSALLNALVKLAVNRARPVVADPVAHAGGMSFPSGHAQSAIVAASVLLPRLAADAPLRRDPV
jgi:membrane-associated phospholipid phosphatase